MYRTLLIAWVTVVTTASVGQAAHRPAVPARRPLLLAKLREFAGQLLGAFHESRRHRAAIILREHAPLTQLRAGGGANND